MDTITLNHQGRPAALAAANRVWLAAHIEALPTDHRTRRHVCLMAFHARDILTGALPGPYTDHDAERHAHALATELTGTYEPPRP